MVISWRPRHHVHPDCAPAADFLAFDGERVVGRVFQIRRGGRSERWYWILMTTGSSLLLEPPSGVEERQAEAETSLSQTYLRLCSRTGTGDAAP
ncbi:MAG TPA: hypothetical protein VHL98_13690 [Microvirga sp.]|nr:hypothetical protein [Microvirga sp.]